MLFTKWDWDVAKRIWQEEAMETGMEKGIAIGNARLLQAARQMKAKGFNSSVISEVTGLSEEEIELLDY